MASESGDRTLSRQGTGQPELDQFPCPRCNSTNTKFCYYNNYNLSQPRHFCKACRRYWTRGGALRNIPVGGGTRKAHSSNKRPRIAPSTPTSAAATTSSTSLVSCSTEKEKTGQTHTQTLDGIVTNPGPGPGSGSPAAANLKEAAGRPDSGNSCSWLGGQLGTSDGLFPMTMYGVGVGVGVSASLGYGLGMLEWPMEHMSGGNGGSVSESPGGNAWQMTGGGDDGGAADGDYFSWPDLAIPTPAKALK